MIVININIKNSYAYYISIIFLTIFAMIMLGLFIALFILLYMHIKFILKESGTL